MRMYNKTIVISVLVAAVLIGIMVLFPGRNTAPSAGDSQSIHNVTVEGGTQVITINAKGGYFPRVTQAKAGMPTIVKVSTQGTFDCSSALTIPSIGYSKNLPLSGETEIAIPPQEAGTTIQGLCSMGMYNFVLRFE